MDIYMGSINIVYGLSWIFFFILSVFCFALFALPSFIDKPTHFGIISLFSSKYRMLCLWTSMEFELAKELKWQPAQLAAMLMIIDKLAQHKSVQTLAASIKHSN